MGGMSRPLFLVYNFTRTCEPAPPPSKQNKFCEATPLLVAKPPSFAKTATPPLKILSPHSTATMPEKQIEAISPCFQLLVVAPKM